MRLKILISIFILLTITAYSYAEEQNSGFYGNVVLGGGYMSNKPAGDEVGDDNKNIKNLTDKQDSESQAGPYVDLVLGYMNANSGTNISVGAGIESGLMLNVTQQAGSFASIGATLSYAQKKVWKDPYVNAPMTGASTSYKRDKTDEKIISAKLSFSEIFDTGAYFAVQTTSFDVKNDDVQYKELERDGSSYGVSFGYKFNFSENHYIFPVLSGNIHNMDGDSNDKDESSLDLTHMIQLGRVGFETTLTYSYSKHDKENPVFGKKRKDEGFSISENVSYSEPFGLNNTTFFVTGGYSNTNSNINFYDSSGYYFMTGMGLSF